MSFRLKLFIMTFFLCVIPLAAVGTFMFKAGETSLRRAAFHELKAINQLSSEVLDHWINQSATLLESLAQRPFIIQATKQLEEPFLTQKEQSRIKEQLHNAHLAPALQMQSDLENISIIDTNSGFILFSTDTRLEGQFRGVDDFFLQGAQGTYVSSVTHSVSLGETVMRVATPIKNGRGNTLAILSGSVRWEKASQILGSVSSQSETMESYLVNRYHYMVTDSRFIDNSAMQLFVTTDGMKACMEDGGGQRTYQDYRNQRVFGVYKWLPDRGLCLITEEDEDEILSHITGLKLQIAGMVFLVTSIAVFFSWWLANSMTRPISILVQGTRYFGRGDLSYRIPSTKGELGIVADSLNDMASNLAAITASKNELDQEVGRRKETEVRLKKRTLALQHSNRDLEEFAYAASHDLQEPLRIISGYLQLLDRRYRGSIDEDATEFINFTVDAAQRMQMLINDLLNYSRIGRKNRKLIDVDMNLALETAIGQLHHLISDNDVRIDYAALPVVTCNETLVVQLLQNLIGNAIKFKSESPLHIEVTATDQKKDLLFAVKDNGIGIEPEFCERIFKIFQRLHSRQDYPGTGIGLALCQRIVNFHGGRIWVESEPGEGSTFYFTLAKHHD